VNKFHIKKISEIDIKKLIQFYQVSFQYEKSILDNYQWRYRSKFNEFEPLILIIDNQICGHAGLIPIDLKINDKRQKAIWFTDFYIASEQRSKGYGKLLAEEWMKICPIQITICNDQSLKVFKKLNWSNNNSFVRRLKIYNYLNIVPAFRRPNGSSFIKDDLQDLKLEELNNKTIAKMADLSEHNLLKKSVGLIRDENWFKWRILDCPYKKDIYIFKFKENFIVTHIKLKNNLKILSILYSSQPITSSIIKLFSKFSKKNSVDYLSYISNEKKIFDFFLPWQRKLNFACNTENRSDTNVLNKSYDDIQFLDSDIDYI
jgi:hypothetical protein